MSILSTLVLITNLAFSVCYNTETRCPEWVSYYLEPCEVIHRERIPMDFKADPRVKESDVGNLYVRSGFDRGHMAPAADFNFDTNALAQTYLFSNIAPQYPAMNRGVWCDIEKEIRRMAESGTVHIVMFPHYSDAVTNMLVTIRIPDSFTKVAYGWFGVRAWNVGNTTNPVCRILR